MLSNKYLTEDEIFRLGGKVADRIVQNHGTVLRQTQAEIKDAAEFLKITQIDAKVAIEYYNFGHTYPEPPMVRRR